MMPMKKPISWYTIAIRNIGPRAEAFEGVMAGTMLAKMSAGSATFMVTIDAPREAAGGNMSILTRTYPHMIAANL